MYQTDTFSAIEAEVSIRKNISLCLKDMFLIQALIWWKAHNYGNNVCSDFSRDSYAEYYVHIVCQ